MAAWWRQRDRPDGRRASNPNLTAAVLLCRSMPSWAPRLPISFGGGGTAAKVRDGGCLCGHPLFYGRLIPPGVLPQVPDELPEVRLQVVDHPDDQGVPSLPLPLPAATAASPPSCSPPTVRHQTLLNSFLAGPALISQRTAVQLGLPPAANRVLLTLAAGSDCVLAAAVVAAPPSDASAAATAVADGCIAVTAVQQYSSTTCIWELACTPSSTSLCLLLERPLSWWIWRQKSLCWTGSRPMAQRMRCRQAGWLAGGADGALRASSCRPPLP